MSIDSCDNLIYKAPDETCRKKIDGVEKKSSMENLKEAVSEIDKAMERIYKIHPEWRQ